MTKILSWLKNYWYILAWIIIGLVPVVYCFCFYEYITWEVITGFATWILAGGVFFTFYQIKLTKKSTNAQMALGLFSELRSIESRKRLQRIYEKAPQYFVDFPNNSQVEDIDTILDNLGMVGALIAYGILDEKLAIESFGGVTVFRCWYQFRGYIHTLRLKRGLQCGSYFEDYAYRAFKHWKHKKNNWILRHSNMGERSVDLVETLKKDKTLRPKRLKEQPTIKEIEKEMSKSELKLFPLNPNLYQELGGAGSNKNHP